MVNEDGWLTVIGVGPGSPEYITPAARRAAAAAEVLIGGERALGLFADLDCEKRVITGDLEGLRSFLLKIRGRPAAVLVSGDPGFYSLLAWLKGQFPGEKINVIPGISAVQLAFARLGRGWEDAAFLSCHGRPLEVLEPYLPRLKAAQVRLAILTGGANTPPVIGKYLADHGLGGHKVWVGIDLGGDGEQTAWLTAAELARRPLARPGVVIVGYEPD
ncbi:precorrin-6y C5,15-methyltransferase (decarboxylating) subunit CbiE [Moorella sulfitireducens (nom. illeg.)]|uniref:precorrin-6y C5,15-methyltransferase (decarboxylating) subunit CbiE n=1 Tax=Neomoorella sulfitireducens TaxID=2972948 RepID=UPI0021ACA0CA|nr:precorrin-6y C5,15-methyltransferase (decarboxylating) subunit CbiE [Moorella sulfitireducens]